MTIYETDSPQSGPPAGSNTSWHSRSVAQTVGGDLATRGSSPTDFSSTIGGQSITREPRQVTGQTRTVKTQPKPSVTLDAELIDQAIALVETVDLADPQSITLALSSLVVTVQQLWKSAERASHYHQQILAEVESAVISADQSQEIIDRQLSALRSALIDLRLPILTQANVESVGSLFIDEGFSPLVALEGMEVSEDA